MGPEPLIAPKTAAETQQLNTYNDDHCAIYAYGLGVGETVTISFATENNATVVAVPLPDLTGPFTLTPTVPGAVLDGGYIYVITKSITAGACGVGVQHKRLSA